MSLSSRALWVVERNLGRSLSLADIAAACAVSRHHLAHAFGAAVGMTVMDYVRGRRLTEAAEALAAGAGDILELALASGYGSHEAFTRAFGARFGRSPEAVRRAGSTAGLAIVRPIELAERAGPAAPIPRFEAAGEILAVGLVCRQAFADVTAITAQWRRFGPEVASIPDRVQPIPLGVMTPADDDGAFDYACAVEVAHFGNAPRGLQRLRVPAQHYAVFRHAGHVTRLGATYSAILDDWLPAAGRTLEEGPSLERHLPSFDPMTGDGGLEIWLPLA